MEDYIAINFEVSRSNSFQDIQKHHFVTAADADIDDSIKRKRIHVSLKHDYTLLRIAVNCCLVSGIQ